MSCLALQPCLKACVEGIGISLSAHYWRHCCRCKAHASLLQVGYPCLSLHGGKDQLDRESTIKDFKTDVCTVLVATSVAARGLDVKDLQLVVNYVVPNHHEDYVHRVGRTGEHLSRLHLCTALLRPCLWTTQIRWGLMLT